MANNASASGERGQELANILAKIRRVYNVGFDNLDVDGQSLEVLSIQDMPAHIDSLLRKKAIRDPLRDLPLWAKIWPSSFILGRFLRKCDPAGKTLLEIGAGMGICSLIAARHGFSHILATDINPEALEFAHANILRNNLENVIETRQLDLASPGVDPRFSAGMDIIAGSEILYLDELHRPIINFLDRHMAINGHAYFCVDMARAKPRFQKLAAKTFDVQEGKIGVLAKNGDGGEERRIYSILILKRKL